LNTDEQFLSAEKKSTNFYVHTNNFYCLALVARAIEDGWFNTFFLFFHLYFKNFCRFLSHKVVCTFYKLKFVNVRIRLHFLNSCLIQSKRQIPSSRNHIWKSLFCRLRNIPSRWTTWPGYIRESGTDGNLQGFLHTLKL